MARLQAVEKKSSKPIDFTAKTGGLSLGGIIATPTPKPPAGTAQDDNDDLGKPAPKIVKKKPAAVKATTTSSTKTKPHPLSKSMTAAEAHKITKLASAASTSHKPATTAKSKTSAGAHATQSADKSKKQHQATSKAKDEKYLLPWDDGFEDRYAADHVREEEQVVSCICGEAIDDRYEHRRLIMCDHCCTWYVVRSPDMPRAIVKGSIATTAHEAPQRAPRAAQQID